MTRNSLQQLAGQGQSVWLDHLSRDLIRSGQLEQMVEKDELQGMTSNPTIFHSAISSSDRYDDEIMQLTAQGLSEETIFEKLAVADIQAACDILLGIHDESEGRDGFISLEVSPHLAHDAEGTVAAARRLAADVDRRNLMIKVPATREGLSAIKTLLVDGININITLIFAQAVYRAVAETYISALESRIARGADVSGVASVASTFVSRIDTAIDGQLDAIARARPELAGEANALLGKAAVANSKAVYRIFEETFESPRFQNLVTHGARPQRPLWASTSTKNPAYPETLYVDELIGPNTVNTMPEPTMKAFRDSGEVHQTVRGGRNFWDSVFDRLAALGINLDAVMIQLANEGVQKFADSYDELLADLGTKAAALKA